MKLNIYIIDNWRWIGVAGVNFFKEIFARMKKTS